MGTTKIIAINTFWQIIGKCLSAVLSIISIFLLTRYLGVMQYGNYSLVFSYLSFFGFMSDLGLSLLLVREIASNVQKSRETFLRFLVIKIALTIVSATIAIIGLYFFPYTSEVNKAIIIGALAVSIGSISGFGASFFQAKLRMDLVTIIDQCTKIVTVLIMIIFIYYKLNFYLIISSVLIGNILGLLITVILLARKTNIMEFGRKINLSYNVNKNTIINGLQIGVMSFLAYSYFKADFIILSLYKSSADLGVYGLAYKIIENILLLWGFYMATIYPLFSKNIKTNILKYNEILNTTVKISICFSIVCVLIGLLLAKDIIFIFGGNQFMSSIEPFRILILSVPFFLINNIFYHSFIASYKIYIVILCLFFSLIFNIILNMIYVPKYSYMASSYITLATEILLFFNYLYYGYRKK